jgi:tRNA(adenine34) deaminase
MDRVKKFMNLAIGEAKKAYKKDEVPIGAVIVVGEKVIAKAHNLMEKTQQATAHAEVKAIQKANRKLGSWRLDDAEIFVTIEPCAMCAGAIVNARIKKCYFGAYESKSGCAVSKFSVLTDSGLNHTTSFEGGVEEERCASLIKEYFKQKRKSKN